MNVLRNDLRASMADGAAANLMAGIGETYFPAFVLAISHNQIACGLAATVPMVIGAGVQLLAPWAVARLQSYRLWVVVCAVVQALAFVPMILAAACGAMPVVAAYAIIAVYWATNLGGASAWNAWIETLVPQRIHARFFARRTGLCQAGLLVGIVFGGLSLQFGMRHDSLLLAFAVIFTVAALGRTASGYFLTRQSEPHGPAFDRQAANCATGLSALGEPGMGRLLLFLFLMQTAVQVSGPYFTPFMLRQLEFSYTSFVVLIAVSYVAKIIALPWCGRIAARLGADRLLWIGGAAIIPVAGMWSISNDFYFLAGVQVASGVAWAAYELAVLLTFFEAIPRQRRVAVLTVYNLINALAFLGGSLIGGGVLAWFGSIREAYLLVFLLSSVGRLGALLLFARISRSATVPAVAAFAEPIVIRLPVAPRDPGREPVGQFRESA